MFGKKRQERKERKRREREEKARREHEAMIRPAKEWFAARGVKPKCSQCEGESFREGFTAGLVERYFAAGPNTGSSLRQFHTYPMVCQNCGYILLFHAEKLGYKRR